MTEKQIIQRLMHKVTVLRRVQDNYFKTGDRHRLKESKGLEQDLHDYMQHLRRMGYKEENAEDVMPKQKDLF